jgi:hypothetical protein
MNPEDLKDSTPEDVARQLFSREPMAPNSCQILAYDSGGDMTYIFEVLNIILLEGMNIVSNGFNNIDFNNLTCEHISSMNPWFRSLGFKINVDEYNNKDDRELFKEYYCRIVIRACDEMFFKIKRINKSYHFVLGGDYLDMNRQKTNLKDLYCIFNHSNKTFKISFDFHIAC